MSPRRVYVVAFTVDAQHASDLPEAMDITSGIIDGLPKEWFALYDDTEPYQIISAATVGDLYPEDLNLT